MKFISTLAFLGLLVFGLLANAVDAPIPGGISSLKPNPYDCRISLYATDLPNGLIATFLADAEGGSHGGGNTQSFKGGDYQVNVTADRKWMTLEWMKGTERIASGLFAWNDGSVVHRVVIMYNPKNTDDQVQFSCSEHTDPVSSSTK